MTVTSVSACNSPQTPASDHHLMTIGWPRPVLLKSGVQSDLDRASIRKHWAFNSLPVVVCTTWTARSPPSTVFTFSSQGITSMAAVQIFKNEIVEGYRLQNVRCYTFLLNVSLCDKFGGSVALRHNHSGRRRSYRKMHQDSKHMISGEPLAAKTYLTCCLFSTLAGLVAITNLFEKLPWENPYLFGGLSIGKDWFQAGGVPWTKRQRNNLRKIEKNKKEGQISGWRALDPRGLQWITEIYTLAYLK